MPERQRELYAGPPETFVERRTALAKELRAEGDKAGAAAVAKLRRPSRAAWALNRVAAAHREDLMALIDLGRQLQDVQRGATGGAAELRQLAADRRIVIGRLVDAAEAEAGAGLREKLHGTLEAASVEPDVADALAAGTLDKECDPPSGFGPLGLAPVPAQTAASESESQPEPEPEPEPEPDRRPELESALSDVEAERRRLDMRIRSLEDDLQKVRLRAEKLTVRRDEIKAELNSLGQPD